MNHTKEPWCEGTDEDGDIVFEGGFLDVVADTSREDGDRQKAFANARRIVVCVNACAGIADPSAINELMELAERCLVYMEDEWVANRFRAVLAKLKGGE